MDQYCERLVVRRRVNRLQLDSQIEVQTVSIYVVSLLSIGSTYRPVCSSAPEYFSMPLSSKTVPAISVQSSSLYYTGLLCTEYLAAMSSIFCGLKYMPKLI